MLAPACADEGTTDESGPGIAIELAALNTSNVTYAQYTITVKNADTTPLTIASVQIDSNSYQVGAPSLVRYVAPCDATSNNNTVTVTVDALSVGGTALPAAALPASQTKSVQCVANQDVPVAFDFFAVASSELGFFDITVGTDVITCSAKLDCQTDTGFFPSASGVVLGFSCTMPAATTTDPVLHMDTIDITCSGGPATVTVDADVAGNISVGDTTKVSVTPYSIVNSVTVFRGEDTIGTTTNTYWNVALGIDPGVLDETCTLVTKATVTDGDTVPADLPYIDWNVQLTTASGSALTCTTHPLFGESPNGGVTSAWPTSPNPAEFDNIYTGNPTAFVTSDTYTPGTAYTGSNAFFASVADANDICIDVADAAGLAGASWVAWLSDTATVDPVDAAGQVSIEQLRLVGGIVIALGKTDLLDGSLAVAINKDQAGAVVSGAPVWTGTSADGTASGSDCLDWTDGSAGQSGTVGTQSATATWTNNGTQLCNVPAHLICIQVP
ncbi:MAG: hypothetical protein CVU56_16415 [Deltaproteobacteria bacterium HGW-Deltaproteobacteria-14]|nr:MAG: hypothetical protein CVU56_16415 [Deltaproteobacteria bacterium HGW-Deltaproteobacteria-14]